MFAQEFPNAIYIGAAPAGNGTGEATTPGVYRKLDSAISVVKPIANRFAIARCDSMRRTACDEIPIGVHRFLIPAEKLPSLYETWGGMNTARLRSQAIYTEPNEPK